jgi:hypothetical protein
MLTPQWGIAVALSKLRRVDIICFTNATEFTLHISALLATTNGEPAQTTPKDPQTGTLLGLPTQQRKDRLQ